MDQLATPDADLRSGKDRKDENFPVGSRLIAPHLRPHVHAYYAFARAADDISDSPDLAPDDKIARLDAMERTLRDEAGAGIVWCEPARSTQLRSQPHARDAKPDGVFYYRFDFQD